MKFQITVVLISALIMLSQQTEIKGKIDTLKSSQFGRTLLETIQMQLQSDDPVGNLVSMMQDLESQAENQLKREDEKYKRATDLCQTDTTQLEETISAAKINSQLLKADIDGLDPLKDQAVQNLNRKEAELKDLEAELQRQGDIRDSQYQAYEAQIDGYEKTLLAFRQNKDGFNEFIDNLEKDRRRFGKPAPVEEESESESSSGDSDSESESESESDSESSGSFIQMNTKVNKFLGEKQSTGINFAQMSQKIQKMKHAVKENGYKALLQTLSQITTNLHNKQQDESAEAEILARKVTSIISQFEEFIEEERSYLDQVDESREDLYKEIERKYTIQINRAKEERVNIQGELESLQNQIKDRTNEKFEVDNKIEQKSKELQDREEECIEITENYKVEVEKLKDEKVQLNVAIDLITTKLGSLKKELLGKSDSD